MALGRWPASHLAGALGVVGLYFAGAVMPPLGAGAALAALLLVVAFWETLTPTPFAALRAEDAG